MHRYILAATVFVASWSGKTRQEATPLTSAEEVATDAIARARAFVAPKRARQRDSVSETLGSARSTPYVLTLGERLALPVRNAGRIAIPTLRGESVDSVGSCIRQTGEVPPYCRTLSPRTSIALSHASTVGDTLATIRVMFSTVRNGERATSYILQVIYRRVDRTSWRFDRVSPIYIVG
jgi:hypothetical protein